MLSFQVKLFGEYIATHESSLPVERERLSDPQTGGMPHYHFHEGEEAIEGEQMQLKTGFLIEKSNV